MQDELTAAQRTSVPSGYVGKGLTIKVRGGRKADLPTN